MVDLAPALVLGRRQALFRREIAGTQSTSDVYLSASARKQHYCALDGGGGQVGGLLESVYTVDGLKKLQTSCIYTTNHLFIKYFKKL